MFVHSFIKKEKQHNWKINTTILKHNIRNTLALSNIIKNNISQGLWYVFDSLALRNAIVSVHFIHRCFIAKLVLELKGNVRGWKVSSPIFQKK